MYDMVKNMHKHFRIGYDGPPRKIDKAEFEFRLKAFREEINEYIEAYEADDLEGQFDALLDLIVFALGACAKHGFPVEQGMHRVMMANMEKEVVKTKDESKRGHAYDLKKPPGWRAPYLNDLLKSSTGPKGLIILDGPDGCGKTTLAEYFVEHHGAHYIHSTWSEDLETRMGEYMERTALVAAEISKNQLVVMDRHWLSELVYADVYRGGSTRGAMHIDMHVLLTGVNRGALVCCLPKNLRASMQHFASLKDSRTEMYTDISEVLLAYEALWEGSEDKYKFKGGREYINALFNENNGLKSIPGVMRFDWMQDGNDLKSYAQSVINEVNQ